jgi:hypothetical protein
MGAFLAVLTLLSAAVGANAAAATPVDDVNIDLGPLIDRAAGVREQFAVEVPHQVSLTRQGTWTSQGTRDMWSLTIQLPTAVTLSFHASDIALPSSAVLTLSGGGTSYRYLPADIRGTQLWSRLVKGDSLTLQLTVDHAQHQGALLEIAAFQAGYRAMGAGTTDHPRYARARAKLQTLSGSCVENYECHLGTGIDNSGQATVVVLVGNQFQCTGVLVNDVPNDGAPYVLTARHCQNGHFGGGSPSSASAVTVYYDATTPCGQAVESIFSSGHVPGAGQATLFEQQDVWLIKLTGAPPGDAYFSGWDASGSPITDGFTVHHAQSDTKQYVAWGGPAASETAPASSLNVSFDTNFIDVINSLGTIDEGASGSGLFTSSGRLVGTLSLGNNSCPVSPPPTATPANAEAKFNALSAVWTSTADTTSTTGSRTLASILDPQETGARSLEGSLAPTQVVFQASATTASTGSKIQLSWSSTGQSCTATGGINGDGWMGSLAASGVKQVGEAAAASVTYGITCSGTGPQGSASATVVWAVGASAISITFTPSFLYVGQTATLSWVAGNVESCTASGGSSGDGWSGPQPLIGSLQITRTVPGSYDYLLTCTHNGVPVTQGTTIPFIQPIANVQLWGGPSTLRIGQTFQLYRSGTLPCTASGGAAGDGWASSSDSADLVSVSTNAPGTYTYTLTCQPSGSIAARASVTLTFTAAPASVTLTANPTTSQSMAGAGSGPPNLSYVANVQPCSVSYVGPVAGTVFSGGPATGTASDIRSIAGTYTYTATCGSGADQAQSTAQIIWTQPTPNVRLVAQPTVPMIIGQGQASLDVLTNVLPCTMTGGGPGDGWAGTITSLRFFNITEQTPGTYTYSVTCGVGRTASTQASIAFANPGGTVLTLTAPGAGYGNLGYTTPISWNSQVGPCTLYGGNGVDGWGGPQPNSGTINVSSAGTADVTYTIVCGTGAQAVEAQTGLYWQRPIPNPSFSWDQNLSPTVGASVSFTWTTLAGATCTAAGGVPGDGWTGPQPSSGSFVVSESKPGQVGYQLDCSLNGVQGYGAAFVPWLPQLPTITLSAAPEQVTLGTPEKLSWSVSNATRCESLLGPGSPTAGTPWNAQLDYLNQTSTVLTEGATGTYQYVLRCFAGNPSDDTQVSSSATATVTVSAAGASGGGAGAPSGGSGVTVTGSTGGGGGGAIDLRVLLALALASSRQLWLARRRARRPPP